jgi:hypothetical protein
LESLIQITYDHQKVQQYCNNPKNSGTSEETSSKERDKIYGLQGITILMPGDHENVGKNLNSEPNVSIFCYFIIKHPQAC